MRHQHGRNDRARIEALADCIEGEGSAPARMGGDSGVCAVARVVSEDGLNVEPWRRRLGRLKRGSDACPEGCPRDPGPRSLGQRQPCPLALRPISGRIACNDCYSVIPVGAFLDFFELEVCRVKEG